MKGVIILRLCSSTASWQESAVKGGRPSGNGWIYRRVQVPRPFHEINTPTRGAINAKYTPGSRGATFPNREKGEFVRNDATDSDSIEFCFHRAKVILYE
jgi:hypothetical protein